MIKREEILDKIKKKGGMISFSEAGRIGIRGRVLKKLVEDGDLEKVSRGIYSLAVMEDISDILIVAKKIPNAVICMESALTHYQMTNVIPSRIHIALPKGTRKPNLTYPKIKVYNFSEKQYKTGIIKKKIDGITVNIYDREKTVIDMLRYRNKKSMEIIKQVFVEYLAEKTRDIRKLLEYSKICRINAETKHVLEWIT